MFSDGEEPEGKPESKPEFGLVGAPTRANETPSASPAHHRRLASRIPPEFFEPPDRDDFKHIFRDEAAQVVDRFLCRLSGHEATCRLAVGRLAIRLLDTRAYHRLGFARIGDYTQERLGLSARELQYAAQATRVTDGIAPLGRAFEAGRLNWTKLRVISAVVTEDSAERWIAQAERCTYRELAAAVGAFAAEHSAPAAASAADPDDAHRIDGEPRSEIRLRMPARVRSLWREVSELASRSAGSPLSTWQVAEIVAAEAMSGAPLGGGLAWRGDGGRDGTDSRALCDDGEGSDGAVDGGDIRGDDDGDVRADDGDVRADADADAERDSRDAARARLQHFINGSVRETDCTAATVAYVGDGEVDELQQLRDLLCAGPRTGDFRLPAVSVAAIAELSPRGLDAALRAQLRSMQDVDWQIGALLQTVKRLRLYRNMGFRSLGAYVADRLGISGRKAGALIRLEGDRSQGHEALMAAYRAGRISWSRALAVLPVLSDRYAGDWIERACNVTVRRLAAETTWARDMRDRLGGWQPIAPPPLGARLDFTEDEAKRQMRSRLSGTQIERLLRPNDWSEVRLHLAGPESVVELFCDALSAFCDSFEAPWRGLERMLLHVKAVWENVPRHRNPIYARDGWRCRVPACSSRRNLQEHHIQFRSRGGGNERGNRVPICAWHHLRGIHGGVVRAHGDAEGEIHWQLGVGHGALDRAGRPFLATRDDVYENAAASSA